MKKIFTFLAYLTGIAVMLWGLTIIVISLVNILKIVL